MPRRDRPLSRTTSRRRPCRPSTRSCRGATPSTSSPDRPDSTRPYWPPRPRSIRVTASTSIFPTTSPTTPRRWREEVTAAGATSYDEGPPPPGLVQIGVHLQPGGTAGSRQQRDRGLPARQGRLLRTVRRHLRGDDAVARDPGPRGGRVHHRETDRRREVLGDRAQRSRVAGSVVRRSGLGAVRTHPWPWCIGGTELHGRGSSAGHLDRHPAGRRAAHPRRGGDRPRQHRADHAAPDSGGRRPRRTDPSGTARLDRNSIERRWQRVDPVGTPRRDRLAVAAPPIGRRIRRRARRSPSEQLANNWDRAVDALRLVDVPIVASATPTETAIVAVRTFPIVSRPMRSLADTITVATYAEDGAVDLDHVGAYGASTVRDASHWARQIERAVNDSVPKRVRVYRYFTNWK